MKKSSGKTVTKTKDHIICHFGLSIKTFYDKGTPFVNRFVRELLSTYGVNHVNALLSSCEWLGKGHKHNFAKNVKSDGLTKIWSDSLPFAP